MDLCLDTNACSALMKNRGRARKIIENTGSLIMPAVVLGSRNMENVQKLQVFFSTPGTRIALITQEK